MVNSHKTKIQIESKGKRKHLVQNECTFKCKHCQELFSSWHAIYNHHLSNHKSLGTMPPPNDCVIESKLHFCNQCGKEVLKDNKLIYLHNRKTHADKKSQTIKKSDNYKGTPKVNMIVKNECTFQCKYCPDVFKSWELIMNHQETNHEPHVSAHFPYDSVIKSSYENST